MLPADENFAIGQKDGAHRRHAHSIALFLIALSALVFHAYWYFPFIADDALISLRYAQRLLAGQGLNWSDGHPVEGYSNLLWILLVAGLGVWGFDLIDAARILGMLCTACSFFSVLYILRRRTTVLLSPVIALAFLALSGPFAVWSIGGLEQPLLAALLAGSIALFLPLLEGEAIAVHSTKTLSLLLALICITRPDGPIFLLAFALAALPWIRPYWSFVLRLFLLPALVASAQVIFRLFYYGEWLPNTARVKITFTAHALQLGGNYVWDGLMALAPLSLLALAALPLLLTTQSTRRRGLLFSALTLPWLFYIAAVGGDIFPAWRHFVPVLIIFSLALGEGLILVLQRLHHRTRLALNIALALSFAFYYNNQLRNPLNLAAAQERWEWDGQAVGLVLKHAFSPAQPLFAVDSAGCLPYFSELPAIDMLGLNDHYIAHHPPANFGNGILGHELGDGDYVWRRQPDIISFCWPQGSETACYRSGLQIQEKADFVRDYSLVHLQTPKPHQFLALLWLRKNSEKIGIRATVDQIVIPGYLFNENGETYTYLNASGQLVIAVSATRPAAVTIQREFVGNWRVQIITSDPHKISVAIDDQGAGNTRIGLRSQSSEKVEVQTVILTRE